MSETTCCVCKGNVEEERLYCHMEEIKEVYKTRLYQGHKACLFNIKNLLEQGIKLEFIEIDTSPMKISSTRVEITEDDLYEERYYDNHYMMPQELFRSKGED